MKPAAVTPTDAFPPPHMAATAGRCPPHVRGVYRGVQHFPGVRIVLIDCARCGSTLSESAFDAATAPTVPLAIEARQDAGQYIAHMLQIGR